MKLLYQPTEASPKEWQSIDASQWSNLPSFTCHALNIQGMTFDGADHYAVETVDRQTVNVIVWYDDPKDWPVGQRWARIWTFRHLRPDPRLNGALNTAHSQEIYAEDGIKPLLEAAYGPVIRPWTAFDPRRVNPMPGSWVSDALHEAHQKKQVPTDWRSWTDGLDDVEIDDKGLIKDQRSLGRYFPPKGTKTYYVNGFNSANMSFISPAGSTAKFQRLYDVDPFNIGPVITSASFNTNGNDLTIFGTRPNEPGMPSWFTSGDYRFNMVVTAAGVDLTFGALTQGNGVSGGFHRISNDGATSLQRIQQTQAAFTGSGTHLITLSNPAWSAGSGLDRFAIVISCVKAVGHGTQTLSVQLSTPNNWADGPWPSNFLEIMPSWMGAL